MNKFFKGKKVLITGHTGFKGSWLTAWLKLLGADVFGIALDPITELSNYSISKITKNITDKRIDVTDRNKLIKEITAINPDIIFHLAAQPLVRDSYKFPHKTWNTNLMGTINVLESLSSIKSNCIAIFITSDKCYQNKEWLWGYRENDELGGEDPYSASKAAAENAIRSYTKSFYQNNSNVRIASARAGNVIGGGDWSKDRIIVDCVKAWSMNKSVELRNPYSTRPWQHVLEPLSGYLQLAYKMYYNKELHGESFNFGPLNHESKSVLDLVIEMSNHWKKVKWKIIKNEDEFKESNLLKLDCEKSIKTLDWSSVLNFNETVKYTSNWYSKFYSNDNRKHDLTNNQIKKFMKKMDIKKFSWL